VAGPKEQDRDPNDADKEDLAELERGLAEQSAPEEPEEDEEEPDAEEPDAEEYLREPDERQPRRQRRNARFDDLQRERDAEREARIRLEAQLAAMQQPRQPQQSVQDFEAQVMDEAKRLQNDRLGLQRYAQARGEQLTQAEVDDLMNRELQIQFRQQELAVMLANQRQRASAPQVDPGLAYLQSKYADVAGNRLGVVLAERHYLMARQKGRPDGLDLAEESYQAARAEMRGEKLPKQGERPRPTVESRARYTGTSATGTGSGSARAPQTVTLTKEEADMAKAAFSYEKDPKKRLQRYVTEVKRPAEAAARDRRRA
jgi:hypothetical protein